MYNLNILRKKEKKTLWNTRHFVEKKMDILQHVTKKKSVNILADWIYEIKSVCVSSNRVQWIKHRIQTPNNAACRQVWRWGAVDRKYDFHLFHVPGSTHVFCSLMLPRFQWNTHALPDTFYVQSELPFWIKCHFLCSVRASILDKVWAAFCVLVVCVLVSVS